MGVYVTTMTMPESCFKCPLFHHASWAGEIDCWALNFRYVFKEYKTARQPNCPLIEVEIEDGH